MQRIQTLDDLRSLLSKHLHGTVVRSTLRDAVSAVGLHRLFPHYAVVTIHETRELPAVRQLHPVLSVEGEQGSTLERTHEVRVDPLSTPEIQRALEKLPGPMLYLLPYEMRGESASRLDPSRWKICSIASHLQRRLDARDYFSELAARAGVRIPSSVTVPACAHEDIERFLATHGPCVVQDLDDAAGMGTQFVLCDGDAKEIQLCGSKRITAYIEGPSLSCTGCILGEQILVSPVRAQIVGCGDLSRGASHFCGNEWNIDVPDSVREELQDIVCRFGSVLREEGYRGIFGIDAQLSAVDGKVYAIELNPRLLGTTQLCTLQEVMADLPALLGLHVLTFLDVPFEIPTKTANALASQALDASHLILRNTADTTITVTGEITPGIYAVSNGNVTWKRPGIYLPDIETEGEYLVTMVPKKGRQIGPNAQLIRIQARTRCFDPFKRELLPDAKKLVSFLRNALALKPVG